MEVRDSRSRVLEVLFLLRLKIGLVLKIVMVS